MAEIIHKRSIRSYVKREGRLTRGQARALSDDQSKLLSLAPSIQPSTLFEYPGPIVIEIGFGMGEALLAMAQQQPTVNFIGIEVHRPGVGAFLLNCEKHAVENVRVFNEDVNHVLAACPEHSIDRVQIFFPDPWHKKRHHKRRLIQAKFLTQMARVLKPQGICHIATDWAPYADVIQETLNQHPDFQLSDQDCRMRHLSARPATKYEARGIRHGHGIQEFVYQRCRA